MLASRGDAGSGVGSGGGSGGSIREAGGKFGEIEAAAENAYFRKLVSLKNHETIKIMKHCVIIF